ncbi:uncharacterized protein TNCV_3460601 [Trichonephila clavipes]|nr:uncharacterized protein TNCV_3460601 [Trichonephila clavipes]
MIHPTRQLSSTSPWSNLGIPGTIVGAVVHNPWSTEAHEWDVCCAAPCPIVSAVMSVQKHLYWDLHFIGLSADLLSGADFALY